tara:strand:+ start:80 stop:331 length:252 start_codon:yes stop_codon:yes gene_type:complete
MIPYREPTRLEVLLFNSMISHGINRKDIIKLFKDSNIGQPVNYHTAEKKSISKFSIPIDPTFLKETDKKIYQLENQISRKHMK